MNRRFRTASLIALILTGCAQPAASPPSRPKLVFPVEVAPVEARDVAYTVSATGSVDAWERVQVTARVSGAVDAVRFQEGDAVTSGQGLVDIEPERFRLQADAAAAALRREEAALADAEAALARRNAVTARSPELVSSEELLAFETKLKAAEAEVARARAAAGQAALDLDAARVRAPMGGTVESRSVQTGQWVKPGDVLASLLRREPLLLRFAVPAPDAARIETGTVAEFRVPGDASPHKAAIRHVAGAADPESRLVPVLAEVQGGASLRPGAFAEISVPVGGRSGAPVVPQAAVRPTERGFVAFVVEGDVARERPLQLGLRTADGFVEVKSGLVAGETLVVRGAEALREGAIVSAAAGKAP